MKGDVQVTEIDSFWNLGEKSEKKYSPPPKRDTSAALVTDAGDSNVSDVGGRRIEDTFCTPPSGNGHSAAPKHSVYTPSRRENTALQITPGETVSDYQPEGSLIKRVTVTLWHSSFNYYERFRRNAEKSNSLTGHECPNVPYFSYIPQYAQLKRQQASFYLWFRDQARAGIFLDADFSYVLLYIYEIINLPDLIPPETALKQLTALWLAYRDRYVQLDKYMSEWIADFCLISDLPMPDELLPLIPAVITKTSFKEFYLSAMLKSAGVSPSALDENTIALASILIDTASDYDYRTGKYYSGYPAQFSRHTVAAIAHVIDRMKEYGDELISDGMLPSVLSRDAFCGSLCSMNAKKRIRIEYISFARSYPLRRQLTSMVRYAENRIRAVLRLKARLSCGDLDPRYKAYIDEYFAPFAAATAAKAQAAKAAADVPEYEKLYDAPEIPFTPESAAEIERSSWDVTKKLIVSEETEPEAEPTEQVEEAPEHIGTESDDKTTLLVEALEAAVNGDFESYCREKALFPDDIAGRINDLFSDIIGDIVLEQNGGRYTVIDDYVNDIEKWLKSVGK